LNKIKNKISWIVNNEHFIFFWLLLLAIICYGILIPTLGFYWDDLPYLFQFSAFGSSGFPEYVSSDRPFSAWIFSATTTLFGYNPIGYHSLALLLRWLCAVLFYLIIKEIWPNNRTSNIIAASIMIIYPGFLQQPIAFIYNHHFSVLAMFLASIYLMIRNVKKDKANICISIASIALSFSMFSIENFAMLELIRPFILWKLFNNKTGKKTNRLLKTLLFWAPYLIVLILFIMWRVFIFKFPTYKPSGITEILESPLHAIASILGRIPGDFYTVYLKAWFTSENIPTVSDFGRTATYLFWLVISVMIFLCITMFSFSLSENTGKKKEDKDKFHTNYEMLIGSALLFLFAGSIVWGLDLPIENKFAWDRMTLAFFPSIALLVGFIFSVFERWKIVHVVLITLLFTQTAGENYQNSISFKRDWDNLEDFLTQLSWRIPTLKENTIFITSESGLNYYSDNSLISPINLQYSDRPSDKELSHFVYFTNARTEDWFENDEYELDYKKRYRSFIFYGNTSNAITYQFDPPNCLRIMDRKFSNSITTPNLTDRQVKEIKFTNMNLINREPTHSPFSPLFTESSTDDWCYYFEKADLARQFGDYDEIVRLANEAENSKKYPRIGSEWLPFLEGYLWRGEIEKASKIIEDISNIEGNYQDGMCYTLRRIQNASDFPYKADLGKLIDVNNCAN